MTGHLNTIQHTADLDEGALASLEQERCAVFELEDAVYSMTLTDGVMELLAAFGEFADCDSRAA